MAPAMTDLAEGEFAQPSKATVAAIAAGHPATNIDRVPHWVFDRTSHRYPHSAHATLTAKQFHPRTSSQLTEAGVAASLTRKVCDIETDLVQHAGGAVMDLSIIVKIEVGTGLKKRPVGTHPIC